MSNKERVVLITGASSGIGAALAIRLAEELPNMAMVGRNECNLKRIALYCEKMSKNKPLTIAADLDDDAEAERVIKEVIEHYGRLDILVNNAGVLELGGIKNTSMTAYDKVMTTNVRAVYHLTMLAVPHLINTKGCIVNMSCTCSTKLNTTTLAYNMSKAALDHFTKCVALELAPDGVRVNAINAGFVKTNLMRDVGLTDNQLDMCVNNIVGNMIKPVEAKEIADLLLFLVGDKARSITGSNYVIDGGVSLR